MDLTALTTDSLRELIPRDCEDDRWEMKGAELLQDRGRLKEELGKQVSAFANSGGGYLVLGVDNSGNPEPCHQSVGRQPMQDYLAVMVEQSVEYPLRNCRVHRVPFADDHEKSVFVIAIEDSPAAPHQSKSDRTYYYRIDKHSKPAPHFHLELLRNRFTRAVLDIAEIRPRGVLQPDAFEPNDLPRLLISLTVALVNRSDQTAESWGLIIENGSEGGWRLERNRVELTEATCFRGYDPKLLPRDREPVAVDLSTVAVLPESVSKSGTYVRLRSLMRSFAIRVTPVSQNYVGQTMDFSLAEGSMAAEAEALLASAIA